MARKKLEEKGPDLGWLATYGDMMSLLLCFFILLQTFSSIQLDKFQKAMGSLQGALGVLDIDRGEKIMSRDFAGYDAYIDAKNKLEDYIENQKMDSLLTIEYDQGRSIKVMISSEIGFESGEAQLKKTIYPLLEKIGHIIQSNENLRMIVEGHTDNIAIHTVQFESNWELSSARALSVIKFFINNQGIPPDHLIAVGYGEYRPILPNTSPENRAKNRRVEICIEGKDTMQL